MLSGEVSLRSYILRCLPAAIHSDEHDGGGAAKETSSTSMANRRMFEARTGSSFFPGICFTSHDCLPSLHESFGQFMEAYPQFAETRRADLIRAEEYYHLSLSNHVCLDYIGIGLFSYAESHDVYSSSPPRNPKNNQPSDFPFFSLRYRAVNFKPHLVHGIRVSELEYAIKTRIMNFLNASERDYSVVFTANRTSAFRIVADSYPFQSCKKLLTVYDHENEAVDAMIDSSERRKARVLSADFTWPRLRIQSEKLKTMIVAGAGARKKKKKGLFVFPLHSRVTGTRYSYQWTTLAEENGWHVLLDVCALGPKDMDSFGLSLLRPDFIICSFYKIFGRNPTGFGCLLVKKSTIPILESPATAGILSIVPVNEPETLGRDDVVECRGLAHLDSLGLVQMSNRARYLVNWLVNALSKLHHSSDPNPRHSNNPNQPNNPNPLVKIYGPKTKFNRGPAMAFNLFDCDGQKIEPALVRKLANRCGISLSSGFIHRISFTEKYEKDERRVMERRTMEGRGILGSSSETGITVLTAALGFLANFEDVYRLWIFVAQFLDSNMVETERERFAILNRSTIEI